jgi:hypothetical protein
MNLNETGEYKMNRTTLPSGTYWIGDPCYIMHDTWDKVCDLMDPDTDSACVEGELELNNLKMWIHSTECGDGSYPGSNGFKYFVDSGCIGIIPEGLFGGSKCDLFYLGTTVHSDSPITVTYVGGVYTFTSNDLDITISTCYEEDDYEEDDHEDDN